jgi:hypothetical protein
MQLKPRYFLVAGIVMVCLIFTSFLYDFEIGILKTTSVSPHRMSLIPEATQFSSLNNSAYVFLALGVQANQMNCPAAVESLVRYGGWNGDVYIVTDRENCFDVNSIIKNAGMDKNKFHLTVVNEDFGGGGIDVSHPKIGLRKSRVRSFAMKARLFEFIDEPHIQTIAYIDCDIIFAQQGCAEEFISGGPSWSESKVKFSHLNFENGTLQGLHAGTMVAHREHSKEALKLWRNEIERGQSKGDNHAYMTAFHRVQREIDLARTLNSTTKIKPNIMMPGEISRSKTSRFERFLDPHNTTVHCMNHISKARCLSFGREPIQRFVDRFALRTYDGGVPYCVHAVLQPLLYGWFPFSYLPFCPKMEQYL